MMNAASSFSEFDVVDAETRRVMQSRVNSSVRRNYEMQSTLRDVVTDQWHHGRCKEKGVAEPFFVSVFLGGVYPPRYHNLS